MIRKFGFLFFVVLFYGVCFAQLPVKIIPPSREGDSPIVFFISGDGGWNTFSQSVSDALSKKGIAVAGLDAQKYFWSAKKPDVFTPELSKAITGTMDRFHKKTFTLVGYSFGASVSSFLATNLSADFKNKLRGLILLSPDDKADFEIHVMDMLSIGSKKDTYDVLAEIRKLKASQPVCIFGNKEDTAMRNRFRQAGATVLTLPGNHHYNNNYEAVADAIATNIPKQ